MLSYPIRAKNKSQLWAKDRISGGGQNYDFTKQPIFKTIKPLLTVFFFVVLYSRYNDIRRIRRQGFALNESKKSVLFVPR